MQKEILYERVTILVGQQIMDDYQRHGTVNVKLLWRARRCNACIASGQYNKLSQVTHYIKTGVTPDNPED